MTVADLLSLNDATYSAVAVAGNLPPAAVKCFGGLSVSLVTFLSVVGAGIGFASAVFFAVGTLRLRAREVADIASTYWDFNKHLADSISSQRAEYIVGALLLSLSFVAQLASNLVPSSIMPLAFQSSRQAVGSVVALVVLVVICSALLARFLARSMQRSVKELLEQRVNTQQ